MLVAESKLSAMQKEYKLSVMLPGNGVRKVLDNPQVHGITVAEFDKYLSVKPMRI
jgi:hypothetical protein